MLQGRKEAEGRGAWGFALAAAEIGLRILIMAVVAVVVLAATQSVAAAQEEVRDWDSVTDPAFDSSATDSANRDISSAQADRDAAIDAERDAGCTLCVEAREAEEQREQANEDTYAGTEALVAARAQAIVGAPADTQEQIDAKYEALDTLESYAEEWSPEGPNEGTADPSDVEDARAEVEAQASEVEGSSGSGSGDEGEAAPEDTSETTAAPPAGGSGGDSASGSSDSSGGSDGGDDGGSGGGGSDEGSGGPLAGLSSSRLVTLLAAGLIAIGVIYYVGGLLREGIRARVRRIGRPEQASAPAPKTRKKSEAKSKPQRPPREDRQPRNGDERRGGEPTAERPEKPEKGTTKSAAPEDSQGDSFNLADRLEQMRREDSEGQNPPEQSADKDSTAAELDDLFFNHSDDEDDEDGR